MSKSKRFVLSDGNSVNTKGYRIDINGLDLKRFKSNPVMLYEHDPKNVIGRWTDIQAKDDKLTAVPEFDTEDSEVLNIAGKVERGFLNGASIGIIVNELQNINNIDVVTKSQLFEASIVAVPADAGAVRLYNENLECMTIDKLKLGINQQKQSEIDYKECFRQITSVLGLDPESGIKTVLDRIGETAYTKGESEIKEALDLAVLTLSEYNHYIKMLKGGQSDILQIVADKKQVFLKKQDNDLIDLYNKNSDKILTTFGVDGWNEIKRMGFESAKKIVDSLPERRFYANMVKNSKNIQDLEWYRRNNPKALQENPDLYQSLLKAYSKLNNI